MAATSALASDGKALYGSDGFIKLLALVVEFGEDLVNAHDSFGQRGPTPEREFVGWSLSGSARKKEVSSRCLRRHRILTVGRNRQRVQGPLVGRCTFPA